MASRKKAAKQAAQKRPATKKKAAPKKTAAKKKPHKKIVLPQSIGVVTSIELDPTLKGAFKAGVNDNTVAITYEPQNPSYDQATLAAAVGGFNDPASFGVIVTVGGVGTAMLARVNATRVKWLALIGGTPGDFPTQASGQFLGGVNLDTFSHNADRLRHLDRHHHISASDVCLLYNHNSTCSTVEIDDWSNNLGGAAPVSAFRGANDATKYKDAFDNIHNRAVVISADPFFQQTKAALIKAAQDWVDAGPTGAHKRRVCYPLKAYATNRKPHTLHGPDLVAAYTMMGSKARSYLNSEQAPRLTTLGIGTPVDND